MLTKFYCTFLLSIIFCATAMGQTKWKTLKQEMIFVNPSFKQCHASTVVELNGGRLMAAWFGGDEEGRNNVVIWSSLFENGKWNAPVVAGDGVVNQSTRYPCWNPVLFKSNSGKLFLFYKVGPSPREWWGMVRSSDDEGKTWTVPTRLPDGVLGPIKNKPIQLPDGTILSPSSTEMGSWKVHIESSIDNGTTWKVNPVDHKTTFGVIQPTLLLYSGNRMQMLCRSQNDRIIESWSTDNGKSWSALTKTDMLNPNSGIDAITLKNGLQLLVYNPTARGKGGRAKLNVAVSSDGKTWKDVAILENGTDGEYSYPAVIQASNGQVHITYTFDRRNIKHVVLEEVK